MQKQEFDDYFAVLIKASDRLRTVIYAFIIVFVAMLLYGLNAFVYPVNQYAYDQVNLEARCVNSGLADPNCADVKTKLAAHAISPEMIRDISTSEWEHKLGNAYDQSVKTRTFAFPVFGLETDRDLLWILFPIVGILGYYIVLLALDSVIRMFEFLRTENVDDTMRLRLLQSTLVITTPLQTAGNRPGRVRHIVESGVVITYIWRVLALVVCSIPILLSIMMMADQTNFLASVVWQVRGEKFLYQPSYGFMAELMVEGVLVVVEGWMLYVLILHGQVFGKCQTAVDAALQGTRATR